MPTYANGCDYAFSHPTIPALKAAKLTFACRYLYPMSQKPGTKNLTRDEAATLNRELKHGVVSNYESWASRALEGHDAGVDDARAAQAQHTACGGKLDRPIYFSVDFDAQPNQYPQIRAYMLGVASVIGLNRTGVYGSYSVVKWMLDTNLVKWAWQTYAWSGGRYDERCQLSQDKNGVSLGGAEIDLDSAHAPDFGQWNYQAGDDDDMFDDKDRVKLNYLENAVRTVILDKAHAYSLQGIYSRVDSVEATLAKVPTGAQMAAALATIPGNVRLTDEQIAALLLALANLTEPNPPAEAPPAA